MKLFLTFVMALALSLNAVMGASSIMGNSTFTRNLAIARGAGYGFVVSQIRNNQKWCLTVNEGKVGAKLGFRRCEFDKAPRRQLWKLDAKGKLHTRVNVSKCMILNDNLFDGVLDISWLLQY